MARNDEYINYKFAFNYLEGYIHGMVTHESTRTGAELWELLKDLTELYALEPLKEVMSDV